MTSSGPRPFQRLDDRLAGKPLDEVLLDGVPDHLEHPLRDWIAEAFEDPYVGTNQVLAEAVMLSLGWPGSPHRWPAAVIHARPKADLLVAIDAMLQLNDEHGGTITGQELSELERKLRQGRSAYRVADDGQGLTYRVDPTVEGTFRATVAAAEPTAGALLRKAWHHAYCPNPDPTAAYREAVRAVEEAFVPVISPKNTRASLGTVVRDLRSQKDKWVVALVDAADALASIEPFVDLLDQLWQGQRSRHGGGAASRDQRQEEAEAAVHLAVLAVQWLTTGVLRRKP